MISKNTRKLIQSLSQKKYRVKEQLFLVEGDKMVSELLQSCFVIKKLIATASFLKENSSITASVEEIAETSQEEIKKASLLKHPQNSMAICRIPEPVSLPNKLNGLNLYLDTIQDPGNLGTIIRICDWFGINHLFCSHSTVDLYNPKVIQATMGSFLRVKCKYSDFQAVKQLADRSGIESFGAFLNGQNVYQSPLPQDALLVMGNEGNGITKTIAEVLDHPLTIPSFSTNKKGAESLNVGVATALLCSEFKRRNYSK